MFIQLYTVFQAHFTRPRGQGAGAGAGHIRGVRAITREISQANSHTITMRW
jgi:hypothetical protein